MLRTLGGRKKRFKIHFFEDFGSSFQASHLNISFVDQITSDDLWCRYRFWQRMLLAFEIHTKHPMYPTEGHGPSERFYSVESNLAVGLPLKTMIEFASVEQC